MLFLKFLQLFIDSRWQTPTVIKKQGVLSVNRPLTLKKDTKQICWTLSLELCPSKKTNEDIPRHSKDINTKPLSKGRLSRVKKEPAEYDMPKEIRKILKSSERSFPSKAQERKWSLFSFKISNSSIELNLLSTHRPPQAVWVASSVASSKLTKQATEFLEVSVQLRKVIREVLLAGISSSLNYQYQSICKPTKQLIWWYTLSKLGILNKSQLKKAKRIAGIIQGVFTSHLLSSQRWARTRTNISLKHTTALTKQSRIKK